MALASFHASQALATEGEFSAARPHGPGAAPAASKAGLTAPPRPTILAGMIPPEPGALDVALKFAPLIAAGGIWAIGIVMLFQNRSKTKEAAADRKAAAEDRKAAQAAAADDRKAAADDRKVTQGMLAALQELIRRTSPPPSQDGPQPGPAE